MALLNGMYIFVESENTGRDFDITQHPIEKDIPVTDNVKRAPATLDIQGVIPGDTNNPVHSEEIRQKIVALASSGSLVTYLGINNYVNCLIKSFSTDHTNKVTGAMSFSMTILEVKFANTPYDPTKKIATKQNVYQAATPVIANQGEEQYVIHVVKAGDTVWDLCIKDSASYKSYGWSVEKVLQENPDCFSKPGDPRTMQIGTRLAVGYK